MLVSVQVKYRELKRNSCLKSQLPLSVHACCICSDRLDINISWLLQSFSAFFSESESSVEPAARQLD